MVSPGLREIVLGLLLVAALPCASTTTNAAPGHPDQLRFRRYGAEQGLKSLSVRCLTQDRLGFLWLGTFSGLIRFDGEHFVTFTHDPEVTSSLSDDAVKVILEDSQGRFWVGTSDGGLNLFDRVTRTFTAYRADPKDPKALGDDSVTSLLERSNGELWVGTGDGGLCVLNEDGAGFECFRHEDQDPSSISSNSVSGVAEASSGKLWVSTFDAGLNLFDPDRRTFTHFRNDAEDDRSLGSDRLNCILSDSEDEIWLGTYGHGLLRLDRNGEMIRHYQADPADHRSIQSRGVKALLEDNTGLIWVATWGGGIAIFDREADRFFRHPSNPDDRWSVSDDRVLQLLEDNLGQMWVGTINGLNVHDPRSRLFSGLRHEPGNADSLVEDNVQSVLEDSQGRIWIGTYSEGISRWDPETGDFLNFSHVPGDETSLANNGIWALEEDQKGHIWVGTSRGLHRYDPEIEGFVRYQKNQQDPAPFSGNNILSVLSDNDGMLWLGTWNQGLNLFDPETGTCEHFLPEPDNPKALPPGGIWSLLEDDHGRIWVATGSGGLARFDRKTREFQRFVHDPTNPRSISDDNVRTLFEDSKGRFWIGTGSGLDLWDEKAGSFRRINLSPEPSSVAGIAEEKTGTLWLATTQGLARFEVWSRKHIWYDEADGLQGDQFTTGAAYRGKTGTLYFGGPGGLTFFNPITVGENNEVPPVVLTDFLLLNRPVPVGEGSPLTRDIVFTDHIVLDHTDYSFSFEFAALNLRQPEKNHYSHILEGIDPDWVLTDPVYRRITYTGIRPGTYTFRVKASNDDGYWNEEGARVTVEVLPPWWQTTWFRVVAVSILLLAAYSIFRWRTVALNHRNQLLAGLVAERTAQLEQSNQKLEEAALADPLTGLRNRRFLAQHIDGDIDKILRDAVHSTGSESDFIFLLIDIDHFKAVNDRYGHDAGDRVLKQFATTLEEVCRSSDFILRWGGEEFLVVARFTHRGTAFETAERIRTTIAAKVFDLGEGRSLRMSCSIGVASFPFVVNKSDALSWEQVVSIADQGLYAAKVSGRNTTVCVDATDTTDLDRLISRLVDDFDELVRVGQLQVQVSSTNQFDPAHTVS